MRCHFLRGPWQLTVALSDLSPHQFDMDNDGVLGAAEIAEALRSRGVDVNAEQVGLELYHT